MQPRDTMDLRVYRSADGQYHVASETMKRIGTVKDGSLRRALSKLADEIEKHQR